MTASRTFARKTLLNQLRAILLERGGQVQIVYKHAVSTLQPAHALDMGGEEAAAGEDEANPA